MTTHTKPVDLDTRQPMNGGIRRPLTEAEEALFVADEMRGYAAGATDPRVEGIYTNEAQRLLEGPGKTDGPREKLGTGATHHVIPRPSVE